MLILLLILAYCKENAVIFILSRNSEADSLANTLANFEDMFNKQYQYPYVILNDDTFTQEFKNKINRVVSTEVNYGKLTQEQFGVPSFIDKYKVDEGMKKLKGKNIIYGDSLPYRKMCRFYSGYFFRHPLVNEYRYYWRIEPGVKFTCKVNYDPFEYLRKNEKEYGFTITIKEFMGTIPTLYEETLKFIIKELPLIGNNNLNKWIFDGKLDYNGCHFWSNFEIASFDFFRSPVYLKYFNWLDKSGGFFYERWGDAPVHTLALSLFLDKNKIHFFEDIGYEHPPYNHCPSSPSRQVDCTCNPKHSVDLMNESCLPNWLSNRSTA